MFKKIGSVVALGLLAGLTAVGPMATAASAAVASTVLVADGQWHVLPAGQQAWYTFDYSGDGSQILIRMSAPDGGGLEVWTPDQFAQYQAGNTVDPIGRGSASDIYGGDLIWSGNFDSAGTYHVIVSSGGSEAYYSLTISGSGVNLPKTETKAAETKMTETKAAAAEKATTEKAAAPAKNGANASEALTIDGKWANIGPNQQVWYAIPYGGGDAQMVISMVSDPNTPATFAVYTADEVANGADPVGRGSIDASMGNNQVWAGGFQDAGMVYVVVSGNGVANTGYQLNLQ